MNKLRNRFWLGPLLGLLSLILMIWTEWPIKSETKEIVFQPGELQVLVPSLDGSDQEATAGSLGYPLAFQDARKVTLEWIPIIRKGDHSQITLSFTGNNIPSLEKDIDNAKTPANLPPFENLYQVYTVNTEARIELSGLKEEPAGISGQVLPEAHDLEFHWEIIPNDVGLYEGIAWLYLRFFPILEGDLIEQAVSAQSFEIKVVSFLGINSNYWRVISVLGIIISIFIQKKRIIGFISRVYWTITNKIGN